MAVDVGSVDTTDGATVVVFVAVVVTVVFVAELEVAVVSDTGSSAPSRKYATSATHTTRRVITPERMGFHLLEERGLFRSSKLEIPFAMMRGYFSNRLGQHLIRESKTSSLAKSPSIS